MGIKKDGKEIVDSLIIGKKEDGSIKLDTSGAGAVFISEDDPRYSTIQNYELQNKYNMSCNNDVLTHSSKTVIAEHISIPKDFTLVEHDARLRVYHKTIVKNTDIETVVVTKSTGDFLVSRNRHININGFTLFSTLREDLIIHDRNGIQHLLKSCTMDSTGASKYPVDSIFILDTIDLKNSKKDTYMESHELSRVNKHYISKTNTDLSDLLLKGDVFNSSVLSTVKFSSNSWGEFVLDDKKYIQEYIVPEYNFIITKAKYKKIDSIRTVDYTALGNDVEVDSLKIVLIDNDSEVSDKLYMRILDKVKSVTPVYDISKDSGLYIYENSKLDRYIPPSKYVDMGFRYSDSGVKMNEQNVVEQHKEDIANLNDAHKDKIKTMQTNITNLKAKLADVKHSESKHRLSNGPIMRLMDFVKSVFTAAVGIFSSKLKLAQVLAN